MTGKEDSYRAAAIRALCTITDPVMLQVCLKDIFYSNISCSYQIIPSKYFMCFFYKFSIN